MRKPARCTNSVAFVLPIIDNSILSTYREAMRNLEHVGWKKAMGEEIQSLHKNQTWELVQLPKGKKTIGLQVDIRTLRRVLHERML